MTKARNKTIISLLVILATGTLLRIYNLTARALWHDEAFSALLIKYNFQEMIDRIILDVHPPFYYIALRGWDFFFGDSLFSLRMFSVFCSVLIILAVYLLAKATFKNNKIALFSALLVAINSFQIQYAQEMRMYTLTAFLIVISSYFLLKALYDKQSSRIWFALYITSVVATIYSHYYAFFSIFAQFLFVVYYFWSAFKLNFSNWLKNKNFQHCAISYLLIGIFYIPWLKVFLKQLSQVQENYWIPTMNFWSIPQTIYKLTTGIGIDASNYKWILTGLIIVVIYLFALALKKNKSEAKWLIFLLFIIPFIGAGLLSLKTSIYLDRYFIFVSAFYIILISASVFKIEKKAIRNALIIILILGSASAVVYNLDNLKIKEKPGMAGMAGYLNQEAKPGDKIYVSSSFVYFTFKYYNNTGIYPLLYCPGELSHFSGTALLSPEDIIKDFQQETKKNDIVWVINTSGFGNYQPETPKTWIKQEEKGFQDAYDYQGWIILKKYKVSN
ncbi:MAG: glycosyltransferase family 39 protein [Patescibacteria group bacterium]|nr:glycosyltransferase family 39 protein [Patescibacteria group bacterium]